MFDVFHALGTLPSRRDKLKSPMICIIEFLVYLSVEAFNSALLTASFLEVSSYFPTFFDQINNVRWKTRFLLYCEGTFSDIHYLRI
ncbi:hypothetical protein BpHYR1_007510 [Brachionus plicatilis]|uniref:Uncharacterized protein n=1 Tax=Brachionus plicatilis TaxID=10195 RepID=A0A3M7QNK1_BRAPC|nr:hypothetical protein BpHYR1_007510 [Brachionus plicatilis]